MLLSSPQTACGALTTWSRHNARVIAALVLLSEARGYAYAKTIH